MSEDLQELMDSNPKWYTELQYVDVKKFIQANINSAAMSFIAIGYYLKYVRDNELHNEDGYSSIWEFAKSEFGIGKSSASSFMGINDKFSKDGNSPILLDKYKDFSSSKLAEMLTMTDEQLEEVTPTTTIVQIRQIKKPVDEVFEAVTTETVLTSEQEPEPISSISIDDLELSVRTYNCLKRAGIDTVDELCKLQFQEIICIRNISMKIISEINEKINPLGLKLNLEDVPESANDIPETVNDPPKNVDNELEFENVVDETENDEDLSEDIEDNCEIINCIKYNEVDGCTGHQSFIQGYCESDRCCLECGKNCKARCGEREAISITKSVEIVPEYIETVSEVAETVIEELKNVIEEVETVSADIIQSEPDEPPKPIWSAKQHLKDAIEREEGQIKEMREHWKVKNPDALLKHETILLALKLHLTDMEYPVPVPLKSVQPELPILKNNDLRKDFIDNYSSWPIWIDTELTGERYYRYDLSDDISMVVKNYHSKLFDYNAIKEKFEDRFKDGWGKEEYYLLKTDKHFKDCEVNKQALIDYLKEVQKVGK